MAIIFGHALLSKVLFLIWNKQHQWHFITYCTTELLHIKFNFNLLSKKKRNKQTKIKNKSNSKKINMDYHQASWLVQLTNRFHFGVHLFINISQMMLKRSKDKGVTHKTQLRVWLILLPHFDVSCDILLNKHTAIWNLFFCVIKRQIIVHGEVIYTSVLQ